MIRKSGDKTTVIPNDFRADTGYWLVRSYGTVLDTLKRFDHGRALIRDNLAANVQARAGGEKKVPANASAAPASAT